jgi:ribose transport system ATP-binding protein
LKREILRMNHVSCLDSRMPILDYVSMQVFETEVYGVLCLGYHGIDKLVELICWNSRIQNGQIIYREELVNSVDIGDNSRNHVALIGRNSRLIDDLTLADNMFVIREGVKKFLINKSVIEKQAQMVIDELQLHLSPAIQIKELGVYDRLVAELLCALIEGNSLIILWQVSDLISSEELPRFHSLIRKLAQMGKTFIYIYNHHEVLQQVCDRIAIFNGGRIQKVFLNSDKMHDYMVRFYAKYGYEKMLRLKAKADSKQSVKDLQPVLKLDGVKAGNINDLSFSINPGENVLLFDKSNTIIEDLMGLFAGTIQPEHGTVELPSALINGKSNAGKIGLIQRDPVSNTLFPHLSFIENLCFQIANKIPLFWQKTKLQKSIVNEYQSELGDLLEAPNLFDMKSKDLYTLIYYRYLLSKPDLVVCQQPLSDADMYLRTHILSLITKLHEKGIAALVLSTELYDTVFIADRLIQVENGRIVVE